MKITLYETGTTRSARCRWTLLEAGIAFESVEDSSLIRSDKLKKLQPLGKLPVAVIDGRPLFESAAISTYIADQAPSGELIAAPGTWERGLHDQWVSFGLTEMEAWLWNTTVNRFVLPEDQRIDAGFEQNTMMFKRGAAVLNQVLSDADYLVGNRFSVTDIIVSWTVNWGRRLGHLEGMPALAHYLERLFTRPHCALNQE